MKDMKNQLELKEQKWKIENNGMNLSTYRDI